MRKDTWIFTILLLLLIAPVIGWSQEKDKITRTNKEVVVKIIYGKKIGEFGRKDFEKGTSITPRAFTFDPDNNIYIADTVNEIPRVQVFNSMGIFLRKIPFKSTVKDPLVIDIAIKNGYLYVLLYRENMQVFSLMGKPIRTIEYFNCEFDIKNIWTDALITPARMEIDSIGNIYLSTQFGALVKLDAQGKVLQTWPSRVDHYIDANGNLFVMESSKEKDGLTVKYASDGSKILESTCDKLFPVPSGQRCRLPEFIDKQGRMYRRVRQKFKDYHIPYVMRYTKQASALLEADLYADEISNYYKVDMNGNIYTIIDDLVKYSTSE